MNVPTITMPETEASKVMAEYLKSVRTRQAGEVDEVRKRMAREDASVVEGLRQIIKGRKLINLHDAMQHAGCKPDGTPHLAIARADARIVVLRAEWQTDGNFMFCADGVNPRDRRYQRGRVVRVPKSSIPGCVVNSSMDHHQLQATVPIIPPQFRPASKLDKFHILWEAEWQRIPPVDPFLLRHISGPLYAILAAWNLTEIERAVLGVRIATEGN